MFTKQNTIIDENNVGHQDLSQEKDYPIENIPIHTMAKDLQEMENPVIKGVPYPEKPVAKINLSELTASQKSSPFLNPTEKTPFADEPKIKSNPDYSQVNKAIQPKLNSIPTPTSSTSSNFIPVVIILLITIFVGAGTYYFITTRKTTPEEISANPGDNKPSEDKPSATTTTISADKPNYLSLNTATVDAGMVKKALEKSAQDVIDSGLKTPIEFSVVDQSNNPIEFVDFAKMANITLSAKTMTLLEKDFSLFFFNDNGNAGLALHLKTTDPSLLKNQLSQEESSLHAALATLLPYTEATPPTTPFQTNQYKGNAVRYQNLISPQKLSIDYALQGNNFLLGTTKMTVETLLDKLSLQ